MPDSRDRFYTESIRRAMFDRQVYLDRRRRLVEELRRDIMPEGYISVGSFGESDPWVLTSPTRPYDYTFTMNVPAASARIRFEDLYDSIAAPVTAAPTPEPADPTAWWGPCGDLRCNCLQGVSYRDSRYREIIPGTNERRGYCLTVKPRRGRRFNRYWQANSERRARAYQQQFFPNEKVMDARRTYPRRQGRAPERYTPEQCNVMLSGVTLSIDDNKVY